MAEMSLLKGAVMGIPYCQLLKNTGETASHLKNIGMLT